MKIKLIIHTPEGQAKGTEQKIRPWLLNRSVKCEVYTNKEDNQILWEIEGAPRHILQIQKNVAAFDMLMHKIFTNKMVKKTAEKTLAEGEKEKLEEMLLKQTSIELVKEATAEEIIDDGKSFWTKLKEKFKKE